MYSVFKTVTNTTIFNEIVLTMIIPSRKFVAYKSKDPIILTHFIYVIVQDSICCDRVQARCILRSPEYNRKCICLSKFGTVLLYAMEIILKWK